MKSLEYTLSYSDSVRAAIFLGFERVDNVSAFWERAYVRNGLKWIFDLSRLRAKLGNPTDDQIRRLGYDVDAYYQVNMLRVDAICDTCGGYHYRMDCEYRGIYIPDDMDIEDFL